MDKSDIIHYNTDEIVCPHCGHYYFDCTDFEGETGIENCVNCGEKFTWRKNTFVTWDTYLE